jgi:hypothetical protein
MPYVDRAYDAVRRQSRVDGRSIRGLLRAIEAAVADEPKDRELLRLYNDYGMNYSRVAAELGISRQNATRKVRRAIIRQLVLEEYRAGRDLADIDRQFHNMYPRKDGERTSAR